MLAPDIPMLALGNFQLLGQFSIHKIFKQPFSTHSTFPFYHPQIETLLSTVLCVHLHGWAHSHGDTPLQFEKTVINDSIYLVQDMS